MDCRWREKGVRVWGAIAVLTVLELFNGAVAPAADVAKREVICK